MSQSWAGGSDTRWRRFRLHILERDHWQCTIAAPGCEGTADQVDHILELHQGGAKYDPANCRAACGPCNRGRPRPRPTEEPPPKRVSSW